MVDVDSLSDAELRSKLIEFGFPVMPITGTTRKLMVKKLKMLMDNKNKVNKDNRRSLGRYSSEDDSDSDSKVIKDKYKRATMAAPVMQPPRKKPVKPEDPPLRKEVKTTTTRTTRIIKAARDEYDTGSESDEVADKYDESKRESPVLGDAFKSTPSPSRMSSSFASMTSAADAASDRISQIKSRYSQPYTSYDRSYYSTSTNELQNDKESTPFLSNFTKRLSKLSESPKSTAYDYKSDIIKENDINGGASSSKVYLNSYRAATRGRPSMYDYKLPSQNIFKNNFVPLMVLAVAFLFFIVVAVVYLGIRSDISLDVVTAKVPVCIKSDVSSRRYVNCVLEGEGRYALNLLEVLRPELGKRAVKNKCEDNRIKPYMTEEGIVAFVVANYAIKNETRIAGDINNLEVLSFLNPAWGVGVVQLDKEGVDYSEKNVPENMEQVNEGKRSKITALVARHPYIPWKCYFYNTLWAFFSVLTSLIGGLVILYVINYVFKRYKQVRQKQHEEEMAIVENIIDILQTNAAENDDHYMVINHVRDMILPINDRKKKQKVWSRAVKYIEENESRIRAEVQVVRGEPSEVWRWLGGPNLSTSKNKSWQGQAFETQVGSVNSLPCSPTPCLKIRGMVEEGDRNTHVIKRAVLNKCAQQCRVLHCGVDTNSRCVYLKCADTSDAAVAYRNLHGWWYAGNLVTVKYLRLERYMQRFPDSSVTGPPYLQ